MKACLRALATFLLVVAVSSSLKNHRRLVDKEILSQEEIERTIRRIENGDSNESAELVDVEEEWEEDRRVLTVKSNKRQMRLDLRPAYGLVRPDIRVVVMDNDGETETDLPASLRFGLYRGSVTGSHKGVAALMKNEEGWNGLVSAEDQHFHLHGTKSSSRSLLVPLPTTSEDDSLGADESLEMDLLELGEERDAYNLTGDVIYTRAASSPELKLEVGVTTDADVYKSVQKKYPKADPETKIKEMVLNVVNGMQAYYTASKLNYEISFEIAAIHILKDLPKEIRDKGGNFFAFKFFCGWDATQMNPGRVNYDMGLFLSGSGKNGAGVAPLASACRGSTSCAMVRMTSYSAVLTMSHEVGHNLGTNHDVVKNGSDYNCGPGYIMWYVTNKGANSFSPCSNKKISNYINMLDKRGINCMRSDSKPSMKLCPSTLLPGRNLQPNEQCHVIYGSGKVEGIKYKDYCQQLKCLVSWGYYVPYMGAPLPGSRCGNAHETKMCWQDECLDDAVVYEKIKKLYAGRKPADTTCPLPDMNPTPAPEHLCGAGWQRYGDFCYQLLNKEGTRDEGESACKALGGESHLVSIHSQREADFLHRYGTFYIGLKDESDTSQVGTGVKRDWKWADGSLYAFSRWASKEPNNWRGSEKCATMVGGFFWNDISCGNKYRPVCKKPLVHVCGEGWEEHGDSCYQVITKPGTEKEGEAACKALGKGSQLASILSKDEADFIRSEFRKYGKKIFIGLKDKSYTTQEGQDVKRDWKWTDGSPYSYSAWAGPEPNNYGGSEKCTQLINAYKWNDISCNRKCPSLCKKPLVPPPPPVSTPAPVNPCGEGWKQYKSSCYQMIQKAGTGQEGEAACKTLGGGSQLASVLDRDESDFIATIFTFPSRYYIGLRDKSKTKKQGKDVKREWQWSDGSPYEYKRWARPEPNNWGGSERCTEMNKRSQWNDISCNAKLFPLCKKPLHGHYKCDDERRCTISLIKS